MSLTDNYIIFYSNDIKNDVLLCNFLSNFKLFSNMKILKLLYPFQKKIKTNVFDQIYIDNYSENFFINDSSIIFYLLDHKSINSNFLSIIKNKLIFNSIIDLSFDNITFNDINAELYIHKFINFYNNLNNYSIKNIPNFNIKTTINKKNIINNINTNNNLIILVVYFNNHLNNKNILKVQLVSLLENSKNNYFDKIIIFGSNLNFIKNELYSKNLYNNKLIFINIEKNNMFTDIISYINDNFKNNIILLAKSDIIIPEQLELELLDNNISNNIILNISSTIRLTNGDLIFNDNTNSSNIEELKLLNLSLEQDVLIFKSPLIIDFNNNILNNINIFSKFYELFINHYLINHNYILLNDTNNFKVIRFLSNNNEVFNRIIYDNIPSIELIKDNKDIIFILPENRYTDTISFEHGNNYIENYILKSKFINQYIFNNIISNNSFINQYNNQVFTNSDEQSIYD